MKKLNRKLLGKLNIALVLVLTVLMSGGLGIVSYVLAAAHTSTQEASTSAATTISVVAKAADTGITTITFPQGAPNATIPVPFNNVNGVGSPQVLHSSTSEPVVRLKNTSAGNLLVTLEITTWTNGVAASEDYELVATGTTTITVVDDALSADGNVATVATGVTMAASAYRALYLELVLSGVAGKTGTSTLTVLGETP